MPLHDFRCPHGCTFDALVPHGIDYVPCPNHRLTHAEKVFLRFPMSFVQQDIHYTSPVDGRPVTSKQARIEDLKRNDCVEYDPSMKSYAERKRKEDDAALERAIDETVEREIHTMPSSKREKLVAELDGGMSVEYTRATPETA
jgi:hypothetical protein